MPNPRNSENQLVQLLLEMQERGCRVGEHPLFGGVNVGAHIKDSKHPRGEAGDLNRPKGNDEEDHFFDHFSVEAIARGFGCIWNRGQGKKGFYDHEHHCHVETLSSNKSQYSGRVHPKRKPWTASLTVDGDLGPATITAMQHWLGTFEDGTISPERSSMVGALQRYINTEQPLANHVKVDRVWGPATISGLQRCMDIKPDGVIDKGNSKTIRRLQDRLNRRGHIFLNV